MSQGRMVQKLEAVSLGIAKVKTPRPVAMGSRRGIQMDAFLL
jgi:hypothetical protein